jgi:hypothetical protein
VQAATDAEAPLAVRLAALFHDLAKPLGDAAGVSHTDLGASIARRVTARLRYPVRMQHRVEHIVRHHAFTLTGRSTARRAGSPPTATTSPSPSPTRGRFAAKAMHPRSRAVARLRAELEHEREPALPSRPPSAATT